MKLKHEGLWSDLQKKFSASTRDKLKESGVLKASVGLSQRSWSQLCLKGARKAPFAKSVQLWETPHQEQVCVSYARALSLPIHRPWKGLPLGLSLCV